MEKKLLFASAMAGAVWLLGGCGQPAEIGPDSPRPPAEVTIPGLNLALTEESAGMPELVPPGGSDAVLTAAELTLYEDDGNPITGTLEIVQRAVQMYEEFRFTSVEGDARPWPELTDLSQLIKFDVVRSLPAPPPGKRFVLDPKTKKVSLTNQ
jgi:hypothetical protein